MLLTLEIHHAVLIAIQVYYLMFYPVLQNQRNHLSCPPKLKDKINRRRSPPIPKVKIVRYEQDWCCQQEKAEVFEGGGELGKGETGQEGGEAWDVHPELGGRGLGEAPQYP